MHSRPVVLFSFAFPYGFTMFFQFVDLSIKILCRYGLYYRVIFFVKTVKYFIPKSCFHFILYSMKIHTVLDTHCSFLGDHETEWCMRKKTVDDFSLVYLSFFAVCCA